MVGEGLTYALSVKKKKSPYYVCLYVGIFLFSEEPVNETLE